MFGVIILNCDMLVKTALRFDDDVKRLESHSQCCKQSHMIVIDSYRKCVCVCVYK